MSIDDEYATLVHDDEHHLGPAVGTRDLVRRGHRSLRRRRVATGAVTAAAVAGLVALPVAVQGSGSDDQGAGHTSGFADPGPTDPVATDTTPTDPTPSDSESRTPLITPVVAPPTDCGWFTCVADAERDRSALLGDVLPVDTTALGTHEAVWASQQLVGDPAPGGQVEAPAISLGFVEGASRSVSLPVFRPGHELTPRCGIQLLQSFYQQSWSFLGYVRGTAGSVAYTGPSHGQVEVTSTTVLAGYTVFVAHGQGGAFSRPTGFTAEVDGHPVSVDTAACSFAA